MEEVGFKARYLKREGTSARELKEAGFEARELREAGYNATELQQAGSAAKLSWRVTLVLSVLPPHVVHVTVSHHSSPTVHQQLNDLSVLKAT